MSTTQETKKRPLERAPAPTRPEPDSPKKTGLNNRRLAVVAGLIVSAIVVAGVLLYNTGTPGGDGQTQSPDADPATVADYWRLPDLRQFDQTPDQAPAWQPNQSALDHQRTSEPATDPETEFSGMPAPSWQPKWQADKKVDGFGIDHFDAVERGSIPDEWLSRSNYASDYDWLVANGLG